VASPLGPTATCAPSALRAGLERLTGADQLPPAGRIAPSIRLPLGLEFVQTAVALPCASTATCGSWAHSPVAERVTGAAHLPPAVRVALWIAPPLSSSQTTVAPPWGSSAICGELASCLTGERSTGADQLPPAGRVALWTTDRLPPSLSKSQTA